MIPMMPHRYLNAQNLDMERINDDLEAGARDVNRNLDKRYTYSTLRFPLDGMTQVEGGGVQCRVSIRRPGVSNVVEISAVEISVYASGTATWTLSCSDATWPSMSVVAAGASVEAFAISDSQVSVTSSSGDLNFTIGASAASTIAAGSITLYLRCDRGNQGASHAGYTPTLVDSTTATAGAILDAQLTNLATAVTTDGANNKDLRASLFLVRNLPSGSSVSMHMPSGAVRIMGMTAYITAAIGGTMSFSESTSGNSVPALAGNGATNRNVGSSSVVFTYADAPMTIASDAVLTMTAGGTQPTIIGYMILWWS